MPMPLTTDSMPAALVAARDLHTFASQARGRHVAELLEHVAELLECHTPSAASLDTFIATVPALRLRAFAMTPYPIQQLARAIAAHALPDLAVPPPSLRALARAADAGIEPLRAITWRWICDRRAEANRRRTDALNRPRARPAAGRVP